MFAKLAEDTFKGAAPCKGALIVTPSKVIIATPGPDNNETL